MIAFAGIGDHYYALFAELTWIFGYLALFEASTFVFQYLFCILNSIQGLLIFTFHNMRELAVQQKWREMCGCVKKDISTTNHRTTNEYNRHYKAKNRKYDVLGAPADAVHGSTST